MGSDEKERKGVTRRDFFKGAAVAGAAVAGAGVLTNSAQAKTPGHGGHPGWGYGWEDGGLPLEELIACGKDLESMLLLRSSPMQTQTGRWFKYNLAIEAENDGMIFLITPDSF